MENTPFSFDLSWAQQADQQDDLRGFRESFFFPQHNGKDMLYFTGNSLGLQPKGVRAYIDQELQDWAQYGVEGHFEAKHPWFSGCYEPTHGELAFVVGFVLSTRRQA